LWVWGYNLGTTTTENLTPQHLLPPSGYKFTSIDAGGNHALATLAPVPEPASLSLLGSGAAALLMNRRRFPAGQFSIIV
jgi:hypothetical protein